MYSVDTSSRRPYNFRFLFLPLFLLIALLNILVFCSYIEYIALDIYDVTFSKVFTAQAQIFFYQVKIDFGMGKHTNIAQPCRNIIVSSAYALTSPARSPTRIFHEHANR